jgi:predicted ArsR family transcriptional regulator
VVRPDPYAQQAREDIANRDMFSIEGIEEARATEYIRKQRQISRREYAKQLGVSRETAKRDLGKLVNEGVLAMRRAGRSTVYTLIGS